MTGGRAERREAAVFWIWGHWPCAGAMGMLFSRKAVQRVVPGHDHDQPGDPLRGLSAPFLGMVQVIVYTGAIMMLFLFVLMVVGVDSSDSLIETVRTSAHQRSLRPRPGGCWSALGSGHPGICQSARWTTPTPSPAGTCRGWRN